MAENKEEITDEGQVSSGQEKPIWPLIMVAMALLMGIIFYAFGGLH